MNNYSRGISSILMIHNLNCSEIGCNTGENLSKYFSSASLKLVENEDE